MQLKKTTYFNSIGFSGNNFISPKNEYRFRTGDVLKN